jgi:hypothetical protein
MTTYSYSLDRQVWTGRFTTRKEAADAAITRAVKEATPPETVYVGQRIEPDLRAYGHARGIIDTMRRRVREDNGDVADGFLRGVTDGQISALDCALESTIGDWLGQSGLQPNWVRIEAVGEYPLPAVSAARSSARAADEVSELGVEDSAGSAKASRPPRFRAPHARPVRRTPRTTAYLLSSHLP